MGRPTNKVTKHKDEVMAKISSGLTPEAVLDWLEREHGITCCVHTFQTHLDKWGVDSKRRYVVRGEELEEQQKRIRELYDANYTDLAVFEQMKKEGFRVRSAGGVRRIRLQMGLRKLWSREGGGNDMD
ncbi:MAG: hypothetical protein M1828_002660 [Chrysothrix sp. TS-e1954]|nr:MAG: hypothetical protein M1828_002660 [Chrysothrix sp. TS-e1954]